MLLAALIACSDWGSRAYIVEGTVLEVRPPAEIVLDHEEIKGFMGPMIMPFAIREPALLDGIQRGDLVVARLQIDEQGSWLDALRVTGHSPLPLPVLPPMPLRAGEVLEPVTVDVGDGTVVIGRGQDKPTAVGFLYTRCPLPEFCPALVGKLQALQAEVGTDARLVAITLDPTYDTRPVLDAFAAQVGADAAVWRFGRLDAEALPALAGRAALNVMTQDGEILHGSRLLVLDRDGRLVERYDDNRFPVARVAEQLRTGAPAAPAGSSGTLSP